MIADQRPKRRRRSREGLARSGLQFLVPKTSDRPRVVQSLDNDLSAGLGVAKELAFAKHDPALGRDPQIVERAGARGKLHADRDERHEGRRDLRHRDDFGMVVDEFLDEHFTFVAVLVAATERNPLERRQAAAGGNHHRSGVR